MKKTLMLVFGIITLLIVGIVGLSSALSCDKYIDEAEEDDDNDDFVCD